MSKSKSIIAPLPGVRLKKELTGARAERIQDFMSRQAQDKNFLTVPKAVVALMDLGLDASEQLAKSKAA